MLPRLCVRFRIKYLISIIVTVFILDYFGAFTHYFEKDFYTEFHYPYEGDVLKLARQMRLNQPPEVTPINWYNYTYHTDCNHKCRRADDDGTFAQPRLVFIIKSAMHHFSRRNAIRQTWGYEKRFSDVMVRTVFLLGIANDKADLQTQIDNEHATHNDIVQAGFIDSYFNNTIKTMMGIKWAVNYCPRAKFFMFVDDDYYVSTKNVLRFLRNPINYPEYLEDADETLRKLARRLSQSDLLTNNNSFPVDEHVAEMNDLVNKHSIHTIDNKEHVKQIQYYLDRHYSHNKTMIDDNIAANGDDNAVAPARKLLDLDLPNNVRLFSGFVFSSSPHRHRSSKWYVSLDEYEWHMWPPYVTAGSYILSRDALLDFYYVSLYTKHFRWVINVGSSKPFVVLTLIAICN